MNTLIYEYIVGVIDSPYLEKEYTKLVYLSPDEIYKNIPCKLLGRLNAISIISYTSKGFSDKGYAIFNVKYIGKCIQIKQHMRILIPITQIYPGVIKCSNYGVDIWINASKKFKFNYKIGDMGIVQILKIEDMVYYGKLESIFSKLLPDK